MCISGYLTLRQYLRLRRIPYQTHTLFLGTLSNQLSLSVQLQIKTYSFLYSVLNSNNVLIRYVGNVAKQNAMSPMGSNFATLRSRYGVSFVHKNVDIPLIIKYNSLCASKAAEVSCLQELLDCRNNVCLIEGFNEEEINDMIYNIACM